MVVGGPTAVLDLGGLRIVSDPTFDAPGPHGYLTKTAGPAVKPDELGSMDLVLVSHDNHPDNLDDRGRALALAAPLVLTTRSGAGRLAGQDLPTVYVSGDNASIRTVAEIAWPGRTAAAQRPRNLDPAQALTEPPGWPRAPCAMGLAGEEAVGADLGEFLLEGRLIDAAGDVGLELPERLDGEQRVRLLPDLDDVYECHLVI
jgi:hypothetical protein